VTGLLARVQPSGCLGSKVSLVSSFLSGQTVVVQNRRAQFGGGPARRAITDRRLAECDRSRLPSALRLPGLPVDLLNQVLAELSESLGRAVVPGRQTVPLQSSEQGSEDRVKLRSHLYDPEIRPFPATGRPHLWIIRATTTKEGVL
jgi:hypothetical protein